MDPLSQAIVGSVASQSASRPNQLQMATVCGVLGGMAPDLDILIRSSSDPLMGLEFHRHFTHALPFAPIGAAVVGLLIWLVFYRFESPWRVYLFTLLGYATHGLLDACTSYGTYLYWPFDHARISWDMISIIDPLFTLPLLILVLLAKWRETRFYTLLAAAYMFLYFGFCIYQHDTAIDLLEEKATERGHTISRQAVKPSFGNVALWRTIYVYNGTYHVDAVRTLPFNKPIWYEGSTAPVISAEELKLLVPDSTVQQDDIERFDFFSQGYLAPVPGEELTYGDLRYGILPNLISPIWGISLQPDKPEEHIQFRRFPRMEGEQVDRFIDMLLGKPDSSL